MSEPGQYAVVSEADALANPYPFVYVNSDGSVRELHPSERAYLEEPFWPTDSGRPYVKSGFDSRDGWGSIEGFCRREVVPADHAIGSPPEHDPNPPMGTAEFIEFLKQKSPNHEVVQTSEGTIEVRRVAKNERGGALIGSPSGLLDRLLRLLRRD